MEMNLPEQMGYDRAMVVFSPEGRLFQIEYAKQAVDKGTTTIGIRYNKGVVLAAIKLVPDLFVANKLEKVFKIDDHIGATTCGIVADGRVLIDFARVKAQVNRMTYGEPIEITSLTREIANRSQMFTQYAGIRPYGVSLLIGGHDGEPRLFETDPPGTMKEWYAQALGRGSVAAKKVLKKEYKQGMSKEATIKLAVRALKAGEKIVNSKTLEIAIIEDKFQAFSQEEVKRAIQ